MSDLFGGDTDESGSLTKFSTEPDYDDTGLDWTGVGDDTVTTSGGGNGVGLDWTGVDETSNTSGTGGGFDFSKLNLKDVNEYLKGNMGLLSLLGGAGLAAMGAGTPKTKSSIYQGGIPNLVATRNMITAPPTGRRAGAGGVNYGGDVTYSLAPAGQKPYSLTRGDSAFIADPAGQANVLKGTGGSDTQSMANKIGYNLPGGWDSFTPQQKIAWFNQNNVSVEQLRAAGVPQSDIDWMLQNGYGSAGANAGGAGINALANAQQSAQSKADKIGVQLPSDWSTYNAAQKIAWYNSNNITPAQLLAAGVDQGTIDWMKSNGYGSAGTSGSASNTDTSSGGTGIDALVAAQESAQAKADTIGLELPSNWSTYNADQKIDWYNTNKVTPDQLTAAGVDQETIDWMKQHGYGPATPGQSSGLKYALENNMTEQQYLNNIENWLQSNSDATDQQVADQMVKYGISAEDLVRAHPSFKMNEVKEKLRALGVEGYAQGGIAQGRYLQGGTDGMADEIPAQIGEDQPAALSHGEFVIPADVVSHMGNGNSDAGAKKLYEMMDRIRMARTGNKEQGKKINPDKFMPGGLAKAYANGGSVKNFATGGTTTMPANVTGQQAGFSNWAGEYATDLMGQGRALANMPFQQYMGPLTAGPSALQNKVTQGLESLDFPGTLGKSFTSAGSPTIGEGGQPVGGGGIASSYMNPYLKNVLDPQLEELRRQSQINLQPGLAKLTSAGGFGGGRQAIMESEAGRNLLNAQNTAIGQGYANAYDKAMQQFNTEQGQAKTLADMMASQGATERAIEAEGVAADKAQFEEARANPFKMVQFQQSLLSGMPINASDYTVQDPSTLTKVAQGVNTVDELLKVLYGITPAKKV